MPRLVMPEVLAGVPAADRALHEHRFGGLRRALEEDRGAGAREAALGCDVG